MQAPVSTSNVPASTAQVGLYLLKLRFSPQPGIVGAGSMTLAVTVNAENGALQGQAQGNLEAGTEHPSSFRADVKGAMHSTGLGPIVHVGAVRGEAFVSFPPPAIGSYVAPFAASFQLDANWKGTGQFSVGNTTYRCNIELISRQ